MKFFLKILTLVAFVFQVGCWAPEKEAPTLTEDKVSKIMADFCVADGIVSSMKDKTKDSLTFIYYEQILAIHKITLPEYEKNIGIYANDFEAMKRIIDGCKAILEPESNKSEPE